MADLHTNDIFNILLVGDAGVGKTKLRDRYLEDTYDETYESTYKVNFKAKTIDISTREVELRVWETARRDDEANIYPRHYWEADVCLVVIDPTQPDAVGQYKRHFSMIREKGWDLVNDKYPLIRVVINKVESENDAAVEKAKWALVAAGIDEEEMFLVSAKADFGGGVPNLFEAMGQAIHDKRLADGKTSKRGSRSRFSTTPYTIPLYASSLFFTVTLLAGVSLVLAGVYLVPALLIPGILVSAVGSIGLGIDLFETNRVTPAGRSLVNVLLMRSNAPAWFLGSGLRVLGKAGLVVGIGAGIVAAVAPTLLPVLLLPAIITVGSALVAYLAGKLLEPVEVRLPESQDIPASTLTTDVAAYVEAEGQQNYIVRQARVKALFNRQNVQAEESSSETTPDGTQTPQQ